MATDAEQALLPKPNSEKANPRGRLHRHRQSTIEEFSRQSVWPPSTRQDQIVTDLQLHQESNDSFSCSVVLNQGEKKLPPEKIYVSFSSFPMIKFFGRTWTEFEGERGITPFLTCIQDHFRRVKA